MRSSEQNWSPSCRNWWSRRIFYLFHHTQSAWSCLWILDESRIQYVLRNWKCTIMTLWFVPEWTDNSWKEEFSEAVGPVLIVSASPVAAIRTSSTFTPNMNFLLPSTEKFGSSWQKRLEWWYQNRRRTRVTTWDPRRTARRWFLCGRRTESATSG